MGYWQTVDHFYSDKDFYLDDGSGALAQILLDGAEVLCEGDITYLEASFSKLKDLPPRLYNSIETNENKIKDFKFKRWKPWLWHIEHYRFLEWRIDEGRRLYVLGYAASGLRHSKIEGTPTKMILKKTKTYPFIIGNVQEDILKKHAAKWSLLKIACAPVLFIIGIIPSYLFSRYWS